LGDQQLQTKHAGHGSDEHTFLPVGAIPLAVETATTKHIAINAYRD